MRAVDILEKKKFGIELSREEIEFLISGYVAGDVADYQASAFLMACCLKPLSARETADLTDVMRTSGDTIDFEKEIQGYTTDKHSTGGVGDKTTLVLGPLVAACGGVVAKMSGRGLGHTGGTLDKLESIAGFRTELERSEFIRLVNEVGVAVCGQTGNVVPADKKLYALRDVTATVEDTALIAASIMSKKLAISNRGLVLDVKTGKGAFMKTLEGSISLAQRMVEIGSLMNRDVMALITEMSMPLGEAVGNALEVQEALDTLAGNGPADLVDLCAELGGRMLVLGGQAGSTAEGGQKIQVAIENGSGLAKFEQMVEAQGGSLDSLHHLEFADQVQDFLAPESAWVQELDALAIGHAAMKLGAGRATKEDEIDMGVGLKVLKKIGSKVEKGEALVRIYYRSEAVLAEVLQELGEAYTWSSEPVSQPPIILAEIKRDSMTRF